jgi:pyrroline-5-carboxylate reductase
MKIGFIGLGNMARAIIGGIIENGGIKPEEIIGSDVSSAACENAQKEFGISTCSENAMVAEQSDVLILAVKPQFLDGALEKVKPALKDNTIILSIVAGKTLEYLENLLGKEHSIVRCMPNTPALVGEACTAYTPNEHVTDSQKAIADKLICCFGKAFCVPERLMDAVVGVSGSAPAYVFMFIEAMADGAVAEGMPRNLAYEFAAQAVYGSAKLMMDTGKHPGELKDMVCSPAGTTIEAVRVLEEGNFRATVMDAVIECAEKSKML